MRRYRVRELNGNFTIQVEISDTEGYLWWKKDVKRWVNADRYGMGRNYNYVMFQSPPPMSSLKEAKELIKHWNNSKVEQPKYHYLDKLT